MDTIRVNLVYEMRLILFIILFQKILFAQDSLFWFDMSNVRDPVPKTPMVMDKVFGLSLLHFLLHSCHNECYIMVHQKPDKENL